MYIHIFNYSISLQGNGKKLKSVFCHFVSYAYEHFLFFFLKVILLYEVELSMHILIQIQTFIMTIYYK